MELFSKISNGGVVILTPDMCKQLDELMSKAIAVEVEKEAKIREKLQKKIYTYDEVCDIFQIGNGTIRNWAAEGMLKIINIGGRRYISAESVNKLIKQHTHGKANIFDARRP